MKFVQFETDDGEVFNVEFLTEYGCGEFYEKYEFVRKRLSDEGYDLIIVSKPRDEEND